MLQRKNGAITGDQHHGPRWNGVWPHMLLLSRLLPT